MAIRVGTSLMVINLLYIFVSLMDLQPMSSVGIMANVLSLMSAWMSTCPIMSSWFSYTLVTSWFYHTMSL